VTPPGGLPWPGPGGGGSGEDPALPGGGRDRVHLFGQDQEMSAPGLRKDLPWAEPPRHPADRPTARAAAPHGCRPAAADETRSAEAAVDAHWAEGHALRGRLMAGNRRAPLGSSGGAMATFAGEFRLLTRLASEAANEVWLAEVLEREEQGDGPPVVLCLVAIKRLLPSLRAEQPSVDRFRATALLGAALLHPNLARTFALYERGLDLFVVQELVGGETLSLLAAAARKRGERLRTSAVLHAVDGLLTALAFLHGAGGGLRLVHGDLTADQVVASPDGAVKLIDLGLGQSAGPDGTVNPAPGAIRSFPAYRSPEQLQGRPLDARSDLFSVGAVLWELLANRPLFSAEGAEETCRRVCTLPAPPLRAVWPEAPTALERILVRALAKDPAHRYAKAAALAEDLKALWRREPVQVGPEALAAEVARFAPKAPRARLG
jgi:serine/threonine-protein kinase